MKLSIILVNFNSLEFLKQCLQSLHIFKFNFDIVIVDNNSKDSQVCLLESDFHNLKTYQLSNNLGFSKANNIGASKSSGDYLLFLNPDTLVHEDFISPIVSFLKENPQAGACAPQLTYEDDRYQNSCGFEMGFWYEFMEAFFLIGVYRKLFYFYKIKNQNRPVEVGWVSAACLLIKESVFKDAGGFSDEYFLNYEDIDLCKTLSERGFKNYYFPQYKCVHLDHKSFDTNFKLLIYTRYESRLVYSKKHYNILKRLTVRLIHISGLLIRLPLSLFLYSGNERKSRFKGYLLSLKLYITSR